MDPSDWDNPSVVASNGNWAETVIGNIEVDPKHAEIKFAKSHAGRVLRIVDMIVYLWDEKEKMEICVV